MYTKSKGFIYIFQAYEVIISLLLSLWFLLLSVGSSLLFSKCWDVDSPKLLLRSFWHFSERHATHGSVLTCHCCIGCNLAGWSFLSIGWRRYGLPTAPHCRTGGTDMFEARPCQCLSPSILSRMRHRELFVRWIQPHDRPRRLGCWRWVYLLFAMPWSILFLSHYLTLAQQCLPRQDDQSQVSLEEEQIPLVKRGWTTKHNKEAEI